MVVVVVMMVVVVVVAAAVVVVVMGRGRTQEQGSSGEPREESRPGCHWCNLSRRRIDVDVAASASVAKNS